MKIWFGCTTLEWREYREYYFAIRDEMVKQGGIILYDWIDFADEVSTGKRSNRRARRVYNQVIEAIINADAVVIENTVPNFSTAHQINIALLRRKPTLVLRLHQDKTIFSDSYIESISDPNLVVKEYTLESLPLVIQKFLKFNKLGNEQGRYNVVLESKHKYYLDWASQNKSKSRSEILRQMIEKEMASDTDFERYLATVS